MLNQRKISHPTSQQIEEEGQKLHALDPTSWNIHEGPSNDRLTEILGDKKFAKRLGAPAKTLIEARMKGELGQRPQIIEELSQRFKVKEVPNYWSDENCHIYDGFGPD